MAAPNMLSLTTVTGKTAGQAVGLSATAIVANSAASGKVIRVKSLYVSNVDGATAAEISVTFYDSSVTTSYHITKTINVPADATIDVISKEIYLEEGDELRLAASATGDIEAVCSYEEIS